MRAFYFFYFFSVIRTTPLALNARAAELLPDVHEPPLPVRLGDDRAESAVELPVEVVGEDVEQELDGVSGRWGPARTADTGGRDDTLPADAVVAVINTERDTDPAAYRRIVAAGR